MKKILNKNKNAKVEIISLAKIKSVNGNKEMPTFKAGFPILKNRK
jgi:hypothetical protein